MPAPRAKRGAKRSVVTDAAGVPVGVCHDGANRNDHKLLKATLDSISIERPAPTPEQPQGLCLDKAYDNSEVRELVAEYGFTGRIRAFARVTRRSPISIDARLARPSVGCRGSPLVAEP